jgi:hypothetical protein
MKSIKEINLDEKILGYLAPEKLNGETLPYEVAKILTEDEKLRALAQLASGEISEKTVEFAKTLLK